MQTAKIFDALSSPVRRKILAYLSATSLTAGEIAARFDISKPALSKHLSILENAGLIAGQKKGQFVHYTLVRDNLVNTLNGFVQEVCPFARPLRKESAALAAQKKTSAARPKKSPKTGKKGHEGTPA